MIRYANPSDDFSNEIRKAFYWWIEMGEMNTELVATTTVTAMNAYSKTEKKIKVGRRMSVYSLASISLFLCVNEQFIW